MRQTPMKRFLAAFLLCATLTLSFAGCGNGTPAGTDDTSASGAEDAPTTISLSKEEYTDRTTAAFLSQLVGFFSGYEFVYNSDGSFCVAMPDDWYTFLGGPYADPNPHKKHEDKLIKNEETGLWEAWSDDEYSIDILNQYILRDMVEQYGTVVQKVITEDWAKYDVYDMGGGHRTAGAYALMAKNHYLPAFAGSAEYGNAYSYCSEPCIEDETLGLCAAGMPGTAARLSEIFSCVTSDQDPVLWARFFATMYSLAFVESDIPTLIRRAEKVLPDGSYIRSVADGCFELFEKYPDNWRNAVRWAAQKFGRYHDRMDTDGQLEVNVNSAFVLLALLYGNGDYDATCRIVSLAGYDGDSSGAVCMGILGAMYGTEILPDEVNEKLWQDGQGVIVNLGKPTDKTGYWMCMKGLPERIPIRDIINLYQKNFESILIEEGGRIEGDTYYIPKQPDVGTDTVFFDDFESGTLDGWTVTENVTLEKDGFEGKKTVRIGGNEQENSGISTTLTGLRIGECYRVTCYASSATRTALRIYVKESGADGFFATVYDQENHVKRTLSFRATSEEMELGAYVPAGTGAHKYAMFDYVTVAHVSEKEAAGVVAELSGDGAPVSGKLSLTVVGGGNREILLKITFRNATGKNVPVSVNVNGEDFKTAPFYKTGNTADGTPADAVYIPILCRGETTEVTLDTGSAKLTLTNISAVIQTDLWAE